MTRVAVIRFPLSHIRVSGELRTAHVVCTKWLVTKRDCQIGRLPSSDPVPSLVT